MDCIAREPIEPPKARQNRAERRRAKFSRQAKPQRKPECKASAWNAIKHVSIHAATSLPVTPDVHEPIISAGYLAVDSLATGKCDRDTYLNLATFNVVGHAIAARIHEYGNTAESREQMLAIEPVFERAGDAMNSIGERFNRTGKFGATGDELEQVRDMMRTLDQLIPLVTLGHLQAATIQAERDIQRAIMQGAPT